MVVSDQRCHGTTRPAVITEPCNTECELRFVAPQGHERERIISHLTRAWPCCVQVARGPQERVHGPVRPGIPDPGNILRQDQPRRRKDPEGGRPLLQRAAQTRQQGSLPRRLQPGRLGLLALVGGRCGGGFFFFSLSRTLVAVFLTFSPVFLRRQCTKSCGGGTRRRGAVCRKAAESGGDESKCSQRDKLTVQSCNEFLCPQWKTGDWSEVSSAPGRWGPSVY